VAVWVCQQAEPKARNNTLTSEEIKEVFLSSRKLFENSGLKPAYSRSYREENLRKSLDLVKDVSFEGTVVDLGADDNKLGYELLQLHPAIKQVIGIDIEKRDNVIEGGKLHFLVPIHADV